MKYYSPPRAPLKSVVEPEFDEDGEPLVFDSYLEPVTKRRVRLSGCTCTIPCLGFCCRSRHHRGNPRAPWCLGVSESESCDDCAAIEARRRGKW